MSTAPRSDAYELDHLNPAWLPAPLGLRGTPLLEWVAAISQADGRCQCDQGDCGRKHTKDTKRCPHVHGIYMDGERQLMSVMPTGEVFCGPCVNGMRRIEQRYQAAAAEGMEGLF